MSEYINGLKWLGEIFLLINIRFKPLPLPASSLGFPSEQTKIYYFQFMDVKILIKMSSNEETL